MRRTHGNACEPKMNILAKIKNLLSVAVCVYRMKWVFFWFTLTLEALDTKAPDEVLAMAAEGWLLEEALNELVLLDHGDGLLTHGTSPVELLGICLEAILTTLSTLGQSTTRFVLVLCWTSLVHNECEVWHVNPGALL